MTSDPWWIFTVVNLFWNIKFRYELGFVEIVRVSPRFGILFLCMSLSVIFIIVDILSVTPVIPIGFINPFWKFAFVFKCFTDSIILDDFKAALDKLSQRHMSQFLPFTNLAGDASAHKWPKAYDGNQDTKSITHADGSYRQTYMELSDVRGLCSPSAARTQHIENRASRGSDD